MTNKNQIFLTCLSSYNSGRLHGEWVPVESVEQLNEAWEKIQATAPYPAEEYFITDYELQGADIDEYTSFNHIVELCEFIDEHGEAGVLAYNYCGGNLDDAKNMMSNYITSVDNPAEYAEEYLADTGVEIPDFVSWHIDYESLGESLMNDYTRLEGDSTTHLFC